MAQLATCPICGYIALPVHSECQVCGCPPYSEDMREDGFATAEAYERDQQLFFFFPETDDEPVEFFSPFDVEGFRQDPTWRPRVTEDEVRAAAAEFRAL